MKIAVVVGLQLVIALIHIFRVGTFFSGKLYIYYYSFFGDFILPFGMYFLLCIQDKSIPFLRSWKVRALIVFGVATLAEILQGFGVYAFGVTFDPLDILMYAAGVLCAVLVDVKILTPKFAFWTN